MFAWIIGVCCLAVVVTLGVLALPALIDDEAGTVGLPVQSGPTREAVPGEPLECRDLYGEALWASLRWGSSGELRQSREAPAVSATPVVDALELDVRFTCAWDSELGTISTTYADAPADAVTVAEGLLPASGFSCADAGERLRCARTDPEAGVVETIELGDGRWLSSVETGWHPERYHGRTADAVWAVSLDA